MYGAAWPPAGPRSSSTGSGPRPAPHPPFNAVQAQGLGPNMLLLHLQPDEGITLRFGEKVPGRGFEVRTVSMDFL